MSTPAWRRCSCIKRKDKIQGAIFLAKRAEERQEEMVLIGFLGFSLHPFIVSKGPEVGNPQRLFATFSISKNWPCTPSNRLGTSAHTEKRPADVHRVKFFPSGSGEQRPEIKSHTLALEKIFKTSVEWKYCKKRRALLSTKGNSDPGLFCVPKEGEQYEVALARSLATSKKKWEQRQGSTLKLRALEASPVEEREHRCLPCLATSIAISQMLVMAKGPEEIECFSLLISISFIGEEGMEAEVGSPGLALVAYQWPAEVYLQRIICWVCLRVDKREER